jgi:hypothetical protein
MAGGEWRKQKRRMAGSCNDEERWSGETSSGSNSGRVEWRV